MPEQLQNIVQEGVKKLREVSTIEWIYCVRLGKIMLELCCMEGTGMLHFQMQYRMHCEKRYWNV